MAGLYLHIPFCKQACHYCDFHFSTSRGQQGELIRALCLELDMQRNYLENESLETIYLGGGTPSLLSGQDLQTLFNAIHKNFSVSNPEITLEANPDDLSAQKITLIKDAGVNRLSIGVQSFDDGVLKFLNRAHSGSEASQCLEVARRAGFDNISIDLIYAIPGQDNSLWKKNLDKVIGLSPPHISAYTLTIEEKTVFGRQQKKGVFKTESDEVAAVQMEMLMDELDHAGYEQYEISNFCKPGFYSRHNSSYWQQKKYLGIGPSAHSYNGESRQFNVSNNAIYVRSMAKGKIPCETEVLSRANKINEYLLTTLRTTWGCSLSYLRSALAFDLLNERHEAIASLEEFELMTRKQDILVLTKKGRLLADKIASDLFIKE